MLRSRRSEKSRGSHWWERTVLEPGKKMNGWMMSMPFGLETHHLNHTQPCRLFLSEGRMPCYCSTMYLAREWKVYVHFLDEQGLQYYAIGGRTTEDWVWKIEPFSPITLSRVRSKGAPLLIQKSDWTKMPPPPHDGSHKLFDSVPWLLKLWKDVELNNWLVEHGMAGQELATAVKPVKSEHTVTAKRLKAAANQRVPATMEEALRDVMPSINGKGRH